MGALDSGGKVTDFGHAMMRFQRTSLRQEGGIWNELSQKCDRFARGGRVGQQDVTQVTKRGVKRSPSISQRSHADPRGAGVRCPQTGARDGERGTRALVWRLGWYAA